ncbi:MAG: ABC transporter ATP-binding protein [Xanthobacteraceae bacterium]|jgi:lipopolysaccharide transport system ATP-binding protein
MSDTVITVENLSKRYVIGHQAADRERYTALRDVMARNARNLWRKTADMARGRAIVAGDETEEFWALKDVSFEVKRGEVLGIIGRNGAGKSTLLKILSRITAPTEGRVHLRGRVASLLEVGTGFHPELTGRENIYLNGVILGMTRTEITRRFDEIVAFAEVEKFLDTPVKRYSSGMYVRLAFAVAAHLEQEILVVDEVLAVGDAEFQKKCLGKMGEVVGAGRTVLFVSHSMGAVRSLCANLILLNDGQIEKRGPTADVIHFYIDFADRAAQSRTIDLSSVRRRGIGAVRIECVEFVNASVPISFRVFEDIVVDFDLVAADPDAMRTATVWMLFRNSSGDDVLMIMQKDAECTMPRAARAKVRMKTSMDLTPGQYDIACGVLGSGDVLDWIDGAFSIQVDNAFIHGGGFDFRLGQVSKRADWKVESHE